MESTSQHLLPLWSRGPRFQQGTHDELMALKGAYFELVNSQQFVTSEDGPDAHGPSSAATAATGSTAAPPAGAPLGTIGEVGVEHAATDATEVMAEADADQAAAIAAPPAFQAVVRRNSTFRDSEV